MSEINYYIIDVETNGLKSKYHEITELSVIRCLDRNQITKHVICENPERSNADALKITGKTLEDLSKGFPKEQVVEIIDNFFNNDEKIPEARCIVGHNVSFDRKFLHALWESCNKQFPAFLWLDTMAMTKNFIDNNSHQNLNFTKTATGKISTKLHSCCDLLGINKISSAHNSKSDSRNTYFLWKKLMELNVDYIPLINSNPHIFLE